MTPDDAPALRAILRTPQVAAWWGPVPDGFPTSDEPDIARLTIVADGRVAGLIQFAEEADPDYRHASIDVFVDPELHGRGIGTEAVRSVAEQLMRDHGHHRITIDPAVDNAAAIRCYLKAGFEPVGVQRAAWRDATAGAWRDVLLMELVRAPAAYNPSSASSHAVWRARSAP